MNQEDLARFVASGVLTKSQADVIFLHDVKGLSYQEIALGLGVARQTVHERCRRGHENIKRSIKEAAA